MASSPMKKKKHHDAPTHDRRTAHTPRRRRISGASEDSETTFPLSEWMVPSQDAHGHSAKVISRIPPSYKHQMNLILQRRKFPWDTESDMVRVAIHRLLNDVSKVMEDKEVMSQQAILNSLVEVASQQMQYLHFRETLERCIITVQGQITEGAIPQAKKLIAAVKEHIEEFEDPDWKEKYRTELVERFKKALEKK